MKMIFKKGDTKTYIKQVQAEDIARFESGIVHEVYATFSIARDAEWSGRLFVLDMKEDDEEGIGTFIHVNHTAPAFVGDEVEYTSTFEEITEKGEIINLFTASCNGKIIAHGKQGQKILKKEKLERILGR
jgi:fluoroacetyl-CoA thioesterase